MIVISGRNGVNGSTGKMPVLHDAVAQRRVFSGKQLLRELITAAIDVIARAGKVMIDSQTCGATKVICQRKNFAGRRAIVDLRLRERTGRADGKQFCCDSDKSGKEQLLTIEFWAESGHCMKQTTREPLACSRRVIHMRSEIGMQVVDPPRADGEPLSRVPYGVKFSRTENRLSALGHRQLRIENRAADFEMWIECLAGDEQPHDFARSFKDGVHAAIAQKS